MLISILGVQFPVSFAVQDNLNHILAVLKHSNECNLVVFPEGSVSGDDIYYNQLVELHNQINNKGYLDLDKNNHRFLIKARKLKE